LHSLNFKLFKFTEKQQNKTGSQKPRVEGSFTLTKYNVSVLRRKNLRVSSLTWGFQKQKDVLPLTNEKGFRAMREQIQGKNGSGTIVFVYHPIISRTPTQAYQVKDDEEKKDVSTSETHWGKKVGVEKEVSSLRCDSCHKLLVLVGSLDMGRISGTFKFLEYLLSSLQYDAAL
jgi:hypothetical protein